MLRKHTLLWFPLPLIFIANGTLRQFGYGPLLTELAAHQISTLSGLILLGFYAWGVGRLWPLKSGSQALSVGCVWLLMTVAFEFVFGHWVIGHCWSVLLHDYNLAAGRLWLLVTAATALFPWAVYKASGRGPL